MSEQDLGEQLAYERERAEKAEAEIERIKSEGKAFEEMLEEESARKEGEIRKLREEAILKQKTFKATKTELAQLQAENAALKEQLSSLSSASQGADPEQMQRVEAESASLKQKVDELGREVGEERERGRKQEELHNSQQEQWARKEKTLKEDLEMAKNLADELKKYNAILNQKLAYYTKPESPQKRSQQGEIERANSKKTIREPADSAVEKDHSEKMRKMEEGYQLKTKQLEELTRSLDESLKRTEMLLKETKQKVQGLSEENQILKGKLKSNGSPSSPAPSPSSPQHNILSHSPQLMESHFSSPLIIKDFPSADEFEQQPGRLSYSCLLLTKPHYISPFLEVYEDKQTVQIYKSTRAGCYQKSMGSYRHRFDVLSFEHEQIIEPIVRSILESQENSHHSVILFGVKRSSKKYLMSQMVVRLKDFLIAKLQNCYECEAVFLKRSQDQAKNSSEQGNDKKAVVDIINKVIALGYKHEKGRVHTASSPRKVQPKPKVRYFSFQADQFRLEVGSSSFTGISFRQSSTPRELLNHILYSRLPDVLQSSRARQHLVLTINPIVDLYDHCRNTLSATFCRARARDESAHEHRISPMRDELNQAARRRFDSIERDHEQSQLRTRKFEEECLYYRARFDELEFRLKGLLNTHAGQTSYLKKSPVTLSYEKLLKFVHTVQARSAQPLPRFSSMALKPVNIYIDSKDNESVL